MSVFTSLIATERLYGEPPLTELGRAQGSWAGATELANSNGGMTYRSANNGARIGASDSPAI